MELSEKEKELLEKLHNGLPANEASRLVQEIEEERRMSMAPETNPDQLKNPQAQKLSDLWFSQRKTATIEQKNKVGLLYISKILNLGDEVAQKFSKGDWTASHQIGMRQGGAEKCTPNLKGFWGEINQLFPGIYTEEDIQFLVSEGGRAGAFYFLLQLEVIGAEKSPVLRALAINAHAYK